MKIKTVCEKTGLTDRTIRYYIEEGLVSPSYTENYLGLNLLKADFAKKSLATADRFNDSPDDFKLLTEDLNADIRDMEGAAIVQASYAAQLPVYSIKAISDVAGSGSTTEQFLINKDKALQNLKAVLPTIFEEL